MIGQLNEAIAVINELEMQGVVSVGILLGSYSQHSMSYWRRQSKGDQLSLELGARNRGWECQPADASVVEDHWPVIIWPRPFFSD